MSRIIPTQFQSVFAGKMPSYHHNDHDDMLIILNIHIIQMTKD